MNFIENFIKNGKKKNQKLIKFLHRSQFYIFLVDHIILFHFNFKQSIFIYKINATFSIPIYLFTGGSDSNKGKSKKWRKILQFPHISQCIQLKDKIGE